MKWVIVFANLVLSLFLGGVLTNYIQVALVQFIFPVLCIIITLFATNSLLWAPLLAFLSGTLFTLSYSLSSYDEFKLYSSISSFFYDTGFISGFFTFLIIVTIKSRKKDYTWL
jgi:hypothetical protein